MAISFAAIILVQDRYALAQGEGPQQAITYAPGKSPLFSYNELVSLSKDDVLSPAMQAKLSTILNSSSRQLVS